MAESGKKKKPQRNALRSQKLIKKAFAKLLYEKELSRITVSDVVKEAEICRGTFYAHYIDITDLFEQMERETVEGVTNFFNNLSAVDLIENPRPTLVVAVEMVEKDKEFFKHLLLNQSAYVVTEKLVNIMRDRFADELTAAYHLKSKEEANAFLVFIANGAEGMFVRWLNDCSPLETDRLLDFVCNMIGGCKQALVGETE